ncbi:hypothetical protein PIB30_064779 [Stylosanthes scabra]|uniref:Uncharacterized protein n=1 Tax=Stylosanthes scabra TaxID=79078 RepID=A0ABU6SLS4_9FABA|nr:hypothetical protein [Stylosanthes scabra]
MVQETFEILMDQVRHLNPAIDYSMITLDTRWDPKAKRIYNPKAEVQDQPEPVEQPEPRAEEQHAEEVVDGEGGNLLRSFIRLCASHLPGDQSEVERRSLVLPL